MRASSTQVRQSNALQLEKGITPRHSIKKKIMANGTRSWHNGKGDRFPVIMILLGKDSEVVFYCLLQIKFTNFTILISELT